MVEVRMRVVVVFTGGTITSLGKSRLDLAWYGENREKADPERLVAEVPELGEFAIVSVEAHPMPLGSALNHDDWIALSKLVRTLCDRADIDGVVVTHGTNMLEETAFSLSLMLRDIRKPIVLTGAMRPASALSSDGPFNLVSAVRVASATQSCGRGVQVVMGSQIFAARDVTKADTYDVGAFCSPSTGPIGFADPDGAVRYLRPATMPYAEMPRFSLTGRLPRVDIASTYVGADGAAIDAFVAAGAKGIVSAGAGAGRPTIAEYDALLRARDAGVVVCQSTRIASGPVFASPQRQLDGIIASGRLGPWKALCLLTLALTLTSEPAEIQAIFDAA